MMRFLMVIVVMLAALAAAPAARAQRSGDVSVSVQAPQEAYVGDTVQLRIIVNGSRDAQPPGISVPGLEINYAGPSDNSSTMTTIINGRMETRQTVVYSHIYTVTAGAAGTYAIPAVEVTVAGKAYRTQPTTLVVREPKQATESTMTLAVEPTEAFVGQPVRLTLTWVLGAELQGYQLSLPVGSGGVGDDSTHELMPGPDPRPPGTPPTDGRFVRLTLNGHDVVGSMRQVTLNGRSVGAVVIEQVVIPRVAGVLNIGPARADMNVVIGRRQRQGFDAMFENPYVTERQFAAAPTVRVNVAPLPEEGRPADFSGLVGSYAVSAAVDATDVAVGDPIKLNVRVTGPHPLSLVPPLDLREQASLREGGKFRLPRDPVLADVDAGTARFGAAVRARSAEVKEIGPIELSYFDPASKMYKVAASRPIPITVRPGIQVTLPGMDEDADEAVAKKDRSILPGGLAGPIREPMERTPPLLAMLNDLRSPVMIALIAAPPVVFGACAAWAMARRNAERDPEGRRRKRAERVFRRAVARVSATPTEREWDVLARALANFAADLAGRSEDVLTGSEAAAVFRGFGTEAGRKLATMAVGIETRRFGMGVGGEAVSENAAAAARAAARELVREVRVKSVRRGSRALAAAGAVVLAVLMMPDVARAEEKAATFESALAAFDGASRQLVTQPAKAKPVLVGIGGEFERLARDAGLTEHARARALFNAGVAYQLGGDLGNAVLCYRRAERLNPMTPGLAMNLAIARKVVSGVTADETSTKGSEPATRAAAVQRVLSLIRAVPHAWLLPSAAVGLGLAWLACAARVAWPRRIGRVVIVPIAVLACVSAAAAGMRWDRERRDRAAMDAVVMMEVTPRSGPDTITFGEAGGLLRAGAEVVKVESRIGGDGREWTRVRGRADEAGSGAMWVPSSVIRIVMAQQSTNVEQTLDKAVQYP